MINTIIVEDDPMVTQINQRYLENFYQLKLQASFQNGADALEYIRREKPRLIILDIYMPKLTGMELLRKIRTEDIKSDVIMVTAASEVAKVDEALRLGIVDYLVKPFEYDRFCKAIVKFLVKANLVDQECSLNQEDLDKLLNADILPVSDISVLKKGIHQLTLNAIYSCMTDKPDNCHTCESLAAEMNLSKVTVRRYLNYLIEMDKLENTVDYETGGRPRLIYRCKTKNE